MLFKLKTERTLRLQVITNICNAADAQGCIKHKNGMNKRQRASRLKSSIVQKKALRGISADPVVPPDGRNAFIVIYMWNPNQRNSLFAVHSVTGYHLRTFNSSVSFDTRLSISYNESGREASTSRCGRHLKSEQVQNLCVCDWLATIKPVLMQDVWAYGWRTSIKSVIKGDE